MLESLQFSSIPKGIEYTQRESMRVITVRGQRSAVTFFGVALFAIGILFACIGFMTFPPKKAPAGIVFILFFGFAGLPFLIVDAKRKVNTEIIIDAQNHFTITKKRKNKIIESIRFEHFEEISCLKKNIQKSELANKLQSYRWMKIAKNDFEFIKIPMHSVEQFKFIHQVLSDLIQANEYAAALEKNPNDNPEIAKVKAFYEEEEE